MRARYLLLVRTGAIDWPDLVANAGRRTGLVAGFAGERIAALVNPDCPCIAVDDRGCILGALFQRHGPAEPVQRLTPAEAATILGSGGDALLTRFWGGYVAAIESDASVTVLRDPSATFPCCFADGSGWTAFASDPELLVECGRVGIEIDWDGLARHLFSAGVPSPSTALRGIGELLAGFSLRAGEVPEPQVPRWSPWSFVGEQAADADIAAERLARIVRQCVRAWAAGRGRLLVSVSGGLDSSIVAAALADARADAVCLTMYDEDPSGDERPYSRALADQLGLPLIERQYQAGDVAIDEPLGTHLPRPQDRTHALAYEQMHLRVGREIGADAFVTGNAGDSVFGYSQSAAAVADLFLSGASWGEIAGSLADTCRQTGCSLFDAAAAAWRLARGPRAYRCRPNPLFLDRQVAAELGRAPLAHPWLDAPADALPGKAAHIAAILRVQQAFEPHRGRWLAVLNPLASQPVAEACLAVPSWQWREGGIDRSLARRAFAGDLPRAVTQRRLKGGPGAFAARMLEQHRGRIRERLLDGHLARRGIIDSVAVQQALSGAHVCSDEERVRILELAAAEAWLDWWIARGAEQGSGTGDVKTFGRSRAS